MRYVASFSVHGESFKPMLEAALKAIGLKAAAPQSGSSRVSFFDTFDWRLYKEGLQCRRVGDLFELRRLDDGERPLLSSPKRPNHSKFAKDFPQGPFREAIESICQTRALIEVCSIYTAFSERRLLDASSKTVVRLRHERVFSEGEGRPELVSCLNVIPMKGYLKEAGLLKAELESLGLPQLRGGHDELRLALGSSGRSPDDYSSSFVAPVRRGMDCRQAASAILLKLIDSMEKNVSGVLNDTDVEFLHDFRVASRRIRSAVSQIKKVFPESDALRLKRDFAEFGRLTNKLRDLDVLLMARVDYEEAVPVELRPGIVSFFHELESRRALEFARLAAELKEPKRAKTLVRWREYLKAAFKLPQTRNSKLPVEELAGDFIAKRLKRVLKMAEKLNESSPDSEMHKLRIECKKLRYLFEFFGPLFDAKTMERLVGRLKRLQDFLGGLNDLSVQQRFLADSLAQMPLDKGKGSILAAAALGALIARLCEARQTLKGSFSKVFDKFLDREEYAELKPLFKAQAPKEEKA